MPKILLVEDDAIQIELIRRHLEPRGYVVIIAKTGQEGIQVARNDKPDLILMDMIMPGMHGLEATIKLKEDPLTAHIPIIALTIMSSPKFVQECYRAGIIGYIKKPYDPGILAESVERVVGKPERKIHSIVIISGASRLATMVEMRLMRQGYQVNTFAGSRSALGYLETESTDAIFLDVSLPEKHVATVFDELRRSERLKAIPVVIFSPQKSPELLEMEVGIWGAQGRISSPSEISEVLSRIKP